MITTITEYLWPGRTQFGFGAAERAGQEAIALGASAAFILTDPGVSAAGLPDPVLASLAAAGITITLYEHCPPNPDFTSVDVAAAAFRASGADLIIGLGGGSPLDAAKAVREQAGGPAEASIAEYVLVLGDDARPAPFVNHMPPMIAIPTTAGTGSEVTPWGVLTDQADRRKKSIGGPNLIPTVALVDPALTMTMPPGLTAATGIDALSHCIEAFVSTNSGPVILDPMILYGVSLINDYLPRAVDDPEDKEARSNVLLASLIGGIAISSRWLGACHSLAHPLSTFAGVHHGLACSLMLPHQMAYTLPAATSRYGQLGSALVSSYPPDTTEETQADQAVAAVQYLIDQVGLPTRLRDAGVDRVLIPEMARHAYLDLNWTTNPRPVTEADLEMLYHQAY